MAVTTISGLNTQIGRNHLINGEFSVAQRGATITAPNDDVYTLDRWNLVSDGNDIVDVTQSTTVPTGGALKSIGLDVETANKQFGIVQIIEAKNCTGLIGNEVTFSFKAKVSNVRLGDVRAGIIAWSSTADSVTSDVVATYNDDANPTLASNLTFENTPSDLGVTTSWVTYSVTATIDTGSTTNVVVWIGSVDSSTTAGDFLYITDCQLEIGPNTSSFEREDYGTTLRKCERYYERIGGGGVVNRIGAGTVQSSTVAVGWIPWSRKRTNPTIVFSDSATGISFQHGAGGDTSTSLAASHISDTSMHLTLTDTSTTLTAGNGCVFYLSLTSSYIEIIAEL